MQSVQIEKQKLVVDTNRVREIASAKGLYDNSFHDNIDEMRPPNVDSFYDGIDEMRPPDAPR